MNRLFTNVLLSASIALSVDAFAQDSKEAKVPFDGMDQTWQNGNDRRTHSVFAIKILYRQRNAGCQLQLFIQQPDR